MSVTRAGVAPLVLLFVLGGMLGDAQAQQTPPAPVPAPAAAASPGLNILVVDVQSLLQNSKVAKTVRQQLEEKSKEYQKELSQQEQELIRERDALQRQQSSLSAESFDQKRRGFQAKLSDHDRNVAGKRQVLERSNAQALEKIQEVMLKIIKEITKDRKANLVFQRSQLVLFDQGFDVTDQVLQKLDEQLPTLTVNFVAPVASNAPNAPPAQPAVAPAPKKRK